MKEKFMTIERWRDPAVRAEVYKYFTDGFRFLDTTQSNGTADTHKVVQDNQPSR